MVTLCKIDDATTLRLNTMRKSVFLYFQFSLVIINLIDKINLKFSIFFSKTIQLKSFDMEEISNALTECYSDKAFGSDGLIYLSSL